MSTRDQPPETAPAAAGTEEVRRESRLLWRFAAGMLVFGIVCWLAFPGAIKITKSFLGRRHLGDLEQLIHDRQWQQAIATLQNARRWAPDDSEVIRATATFMTRAGGDPVHALALLEQLHQGGHATADDVAQIGRLRLTTGDKAGARKIYQQLPPEARRTRDALELQAALLEADGRPEQAAEVLRDALILRADEDTESLLKLARIDLKSSHASRRDAMRERLWRMARGGEPEALPATELLAEDRALTVPQAGELQRLVTTAPGTDAHRDQARLALLTTRVRLSPHLRSELIDAEILLWRGRPPAQIGPLAAWMAAQREFSRILRMMTPEIAGRFSTLLPPYVEALRGFGRWQELEELLATGKIDPAFPVQQRRLWLAELQSHLDGDNSRARQTLAAVLEEARRGSHPRETLEAARLAEHLKLWDLAERGYQALAASNASNRLPMLLKVYEMADARLDGDAMFHTMSEIEDLEPENPLFMLQKLYLQLLIGTGLELACIQAQNLSVPAQFQDRQHLLQALAAHRQRRPRDIPATLAQIREPERLPPGQRAVYAALLKSNGGEAGSVFRIIERISPVVLIAEEKSFYQRAL